MPFAAVLLLAHVAVDGTPVMTWAAAAFSGLRVLHAVGMISGLAQFPLRPLIFTADWVCILVVAWQIVTMA